MPEAWRDAATAGGGSVAKVEYLESRATDPSAAVRRLRSSGAAAPSSVAVPRGIAAFDALLLPEGGAQLKQIARQLKEAGLDPAQVRLLGSGLWDDPTIAGENALDGGWYAASPPEPRQEFESRFQATYGHPAPRLASLAFDAAAPAPLLGRSAPSRALRRWRPAAVAARRSPSRVRNPPSTRSGSAAANNCSTVRSARASRRWRATPSTRRRPIISISPIASSGAIGLCSSIP